MGTRSWGAGRRWRPATFSLSLVHMCALLALLDQKPSLCGLAGQFQGSPGRRSEQDLALEFLVIVPGLACFVPAGWALRALSVLAVGLVLAKWVHEVGLAMLGREQTVGTDSRERLPEPLSVAPRLFVTQH